MVCVSNCRVKTVGGCLAFTLSYITYFNKRQDGEFTFFSYI